MKTRKQGFTLIELVVATLIIGLLAAVLVPNALGARARANNAAVQTFLKNLSQEMEIQYADFGRYYPGDDSGEWFGLDAPDGQDNYVGGEVGFGQTFYIEEFLFSDGIGDDIVGTKGAFDDLFDIEMPRDLSLVFRTDQPDAHSGYCIVARWNSQDDVNYTTYILRPDTGIQALAKNVVASAATSCAAF